MTVSLFSSNPPSIPAEFILFAGFVSSILKMISSERKSMSVFMRMFVTLSDDES